jgi:dTDP-glucose 4,6-dehydratase
VGSGQPALENLAVAFNFMANFWKSKKVFVTGATGFIGSWLAEALVKNQARVTVLVNKNNPFREEAIRHLKNRLKIVYGDIKDGKLTENLVRNNEVLFHLAAVTQVLYSIKNPRETLAVNLNGTFNVLEGMRKSKKNQFLVFVSTDKVYGEPDRLPIDENHRLSAKSPYDASKVAADRLVHAYHETYGIRAAVLRWSNTYGGRDANLLRAVPDFVTSVVDDKVPVIRGKGTHLRDYLYVTDVVCALLLAGEKQKISDGQAFNLGTKKPTSVKELADMIIGLSGKERMEPLILGRETPGEIDRQYLSFGKAKKMLGWKPKIDLQSGLKMTIDWYKNNSWWREVMKRVDDFYGIKIN